MRLRRFLTTDPTRPPFNPVAPYQKSCKVKNLVNIYTGLSNSTHADFHKDPLWAAILKIQSTLWSMF